jgi:biotin carboxylase
MVEVPATVESRTAPGRADAGVPFEYDALVLDAGSRQALATLRSLSRAGLRVAMGECFAECDPALPVLAFRSRYSAHNLVVPSFATDATRFASEILEFVRQHPTRLVLPGSDGSVAAMLPWREKLAALNCHLALPADSVLDIANNKDRTIEVAHSLGIESPRHKHIATIDELLPALSEFEFPIVLKPTSSWAGQSGCRLQVAEVIDEAEAVEVTQRFLTAGAGVLAQQYVGGRREGVIMLVVDGEVHASFAYVPHRTSPALGGASVLRESVPMPADIYAASAQLVTTIGMQGLCEVEFRRDVAGRPFLMEINARLVGGGMETAMRTGIDFPLLLWQWATGLPVDRVDGYRAGIRMRWLRGDMRWLITNSRRAGRPDSVPQATAFLAFATEFIRTRHYDCLDLRDLGPMMAEWRTAVASVRKELW